MKFCGVEYEGDIREVRSRSIVLRFDERLHLQYCGELVSVHFVLSRTTRKRMHMAVDQVYNNFGSKILFPTEVVLLKPQINLEGGVKKRVIKLPSYPCAAAKTDQRPDVLLAQQADNVLETSASSTASCSTTSSGRRRKKQSVAERLLKTQDHQEHLGLFVTPKFPIHLVGKGTPLCLLPTLILL